MSVRFPFSLYPSLINFTRKRVIGRPENRGISILRKKGTAKEMEDAITPEELHRFKELSTSIILHPICNLPPIDINKSLFVKECEAITEMTPPNKILRYLKFRFSDSNHASDRFFRLTLERLQNQELMDLFGLTKGFNDQIYWLFLHYWILHQGFLISYAHCLEQKTDINITEATETMKRKESVNSLDIIGTEKIQITSERIKTNEYHQVEMKFLDDIFTLIKTWISMKKVPDYRFKPEFRNLCDYSYGFCACLDRATVRREMLPGRILEVLHIHLFGGIVPRDDPRLVLLTRYVIRQLNFIMKVPPQYFLHGCFTWTDFPVSRSVVALIGGLLSRDEIGVWA